MKRFFWTVLVFFLSAPTLFAITAEEEQALIDKVYSMFVETSTGLYDSMPPIRTCGTSILTEMMMQYSELSPRAQAVLQQGPFDREPSFDRYDTPSGHFRIHYVDTGVHAVRYPMVKVNRGGQLIPVWVDTLAMVLDSIWEKEVTQMGFRPPVPDGFYPEGEDNRFDVYLKGLSATFLGATVPERTDASPCDPNIFGPLCNRATAYIILDNDYETLPYNDPLYGIGPSGGMRVTAAHEFFHAIQFAYNVFGFEVVSGNQKYYWQEATAVWMEEQMYNEINDYIQYLPFWFDAPQLSFRTFLPPGGDLYRVFRPYA
ncbi:MAG: MXAN_6640 family putative metalloprotease, partial [Limisphaerales bacterium]